MFFSTHNFYIVLSPSINKNKSQNFHETQQNIVWRFIFFITYPVITLCHRIRKNLLGNFAGVHPWLSYKLEHIERQNWKRKGNLAGLEATKNIWKHRDWIDCTKLVSWYNGSAGTQLEWCRIFRKKDFSMTVFNKEVEK